MSNSAGSGNSGVSEAAQRQLETLLEGCLEGNTLSIETALNAAYDLGAAYADVRELREALQELLECNLYCECGGGQEPADKYSDNGHAETCRVVRAEAVLKKHGGQ